MTSRAITFVCPVRSAIRATSSFFVIVRGPSDAGDGEGGIAEPGAGADAAGFGSGRALVGFCGWLEAGSGVMRGFGASQAPVAPPSERIGILGRWPDRLYARPEAKSKGRGQTWGDSNAPDEPRRRYAAARGALARSAEERLDGPP